MGNFLSKSLRWVADKWAGAIISWSLNNSGAVAAMLTFAFGGVLYRYHQAVQQLTRLTWMDWIAVMLGVVFALGAAILFVRFVWLKTKRSQSQTTSGSLGWLKTIGTVLALVLITWLLPRGSMPKPQSPEVAKEPQVLVPPAAGAKAPEEQAKAPKRRKSKVQRPSDSESTTARVVTPGPPAKEIQQPPSVTISPNGGITQSGGGDKSCTQNVIGGNNNTNNCAPLPWVISPEQRTNMDVFLMAIHGRIRIQPLNGEPKAARVARQLYDLFHDDGWTMEDPGLVFFVDDPFSGIRVKLHGETTSKKGELVNIFPDTPEYSIFKAFTAVGHPVISAHREQEQPDGLVSLEVGEIQ